MTASSTLPPALPGADRDLDDEDAGRLHIYESGPDEPGTDTPVVLVHSVNAAANAREMKPLFERLRSDRLVMAFDLPGFGLSERSDRQYTPRLMTDALHAVVADVRGRHGGAAVDAIALSTSCEFLARAVVERPDGYRTAALISPTGFDRRSRKPGPPGSTRGQGWLKGLLTGPGWGRGLFDLLTKPSVVRYFLERTWGSKDIDEDLWAYDVEAARLPAAHHAPLAFLSGYLFSRDARRLYEALELPVWMAHGVRGDFVDYSGKTAFEDRGNWAIQVFETGALPHFEVPDAFVAGYHAFLAEAIRPGGLGDG